MAHTEDFADIIAIAVGDEKPAALEDLVNSYEKESVKRAVKRWKESVAQIFPVLKSSS